MVTAIVSKGQRCVYKHKLTINIYCDIIESERAFDVYGSLLAKLCVHPHTDSKVILRFQRAVLVVNPNYKEQLEKSLKLGLAGRK